MTDNRTLKIIVDILENAWDIALDHIEDPSLKHVIMDRIEEVQHAIIEMITAEERR